MSTRPVRRRLIGPLAGAAIGATVSLGAVSYAQGTGSPSQPAPAAAPVQGNILAKIHAALDRLVADQTITQAQADAVQHQAGEGSIDPKILVQSHVLTDAQMHQVAQSIKGIKQSDQP